MPAIPVTEPSSVSVMMRALSSVVLGTQALARHTNSEAAYRAARFGALGLSGPAPLDIGSANGLGVSSTLYTAPYLDAEAQQRNGFSGHYVSSATFLQCAVRRNEGILDAQTTCLTMGATRILVAGLLLTTTLLRMRRLADMADVQALTGIGLLTTSERHRLRELKQRGSTSLWGALWQLLQLQLVPLVAGGFYVAIHIDGAFLHACNPNYSSEGIMLLLYIWFLPIIASDGLTRTASLTETVGLASETSLMALVSLITLASGAIGRAYLFEFGMAIAIIRFILLAMVVTATLTLPGQWAAYDGWERRIGSVVTTSRCAAAALCLQPAPSRLPLAKRARYGGSNDRSAARGFASLGQARRSCLFRAVVNSATLSDNTASCVIVPIQLFHGLLVMSASCFVSVLKRCGVVRAGCELPCSTGNRHRLERKLSGRRQLEVASRTRSSYRAASGSGKSASAELGDDGNDEAGGEQQTVAAASAPVAVEDADTLMERITAEQVLAHTEAREFFLRHLRAEFSVEAGLFVVDVWTLRDVVDTPDDQVPEAVARIWQEYIAQGADLCVNLSAFVVKRVERELSQLNSDGFYMLGTPGYDADEAARESSDGMEGDESLSPSAMDSVAGGGGPLMELESLPTTSRALQTGDTAAISTFSSARKARGLADQPSAQLRRQQQPGPRGQGRQHDEEEHDGRPGSQQDSGAAIGVEPATHARYQVQRMLLMAASVESPRAVFAEDLERLRAGGHNPGPSGVSGMGGSQESIMSPHGNTSGAQRLGQGPQSGGNEESDADAMAVLSDTESRQDTGQGVSLSPTSAHSGRKVLTAQKILTDRARGVFDTAQQAMLRALQLDGFSRFRRTPMMLEAAVALHGDVIREAFPDQLG
jgi:hypothetical protein